MLEPVQRHDATAQIQVGRSPRRDERECASDPFDEKGEQAVSVVPKKRANLTQDNREQNNRRKEDERQAQQGRDKIVHGGA
jgi:hypothetical protein